jgi:hypothetical protein
MTVEKKVGRQTSEVESVKWQLHVVRIDSLVALLLCHMEHAVCAGACVTAACMRWEAIGSLHVC